MLEDATTKNTKNTKFPWGHGLKDACRLSDLPRGFLVLICFITPSVAAAQRPSAFDFSIKNIMRGPELYGRPPSDVRWSADSRWIYFNWLEPGTDWREQVKRFRIRAVPGAKPERVSPAQFDSVGALVSSGDRSSTGRYMAAEYNGDIYVTDLQTGTMRRLTQTLAREHTPEFAVDANRLFFVRDNNVYAVDLTGGLVQQLTDIRQGPEPVDSARAAGQRGRIEQQQRDLFDAIRDRVRADSIRKAEERERQNRGLKTYYTQRGEELAGLSVAPSGNALLVQTRIPPQGTRGADVMQLVTESGYPEVIRGRTNVGDVQVRGRLGFLSIPSRTIKWLNPFPSDTANGFVQMLGWSADGSRAAFYSYTGDNKVRLLQSIDASTGTLRTLETLRDSAWVGGPCNDCGGWYDNWRRFWYVSEATGFAHLYTVAANGTDRRQLTEGRWEVRDVELSRDEKWFYLHTNEISSAEEQIYRMSVNGGAREKLTTKSGKHAGVVSPNGEWIADVYSFVNRPPDLYIVLDLDYRASDGYGRDWRTAIYRYMGGRDLQDQVDASRYLTKEYSINPERIGLYGGSYGGFITLFALFTQPQYFGAGAALRSVTDWAHYNHGYTSRILNFPQNDTLAYRRSSPIYFAEGLRDPLVMLHGMVDTNVHFEDIVRLTQRFIELGKTGWELAVYPVEDHAFVRPSSWTDEYRRIFELFERTLPTRVPLQRDSTP